MPQIYRWFPKRLSFYIFFFIVAQGGFSMSPFTADSDAIIAMLQGETGLFKVLHGPIVSIKKVSTQKIRDSDSVTTYIDIFEIKTEKISSEEKAKKSCSLTVKVSTKRDFMKKIEPPVVTYGVPICK